MARPMMENIKNCSINNAPNIFDIRSFKFGLLFDTRSLKKNNYVHDRLIQLDLYTRFDCLNLSSHFFQYYFVDDRFEETLFYIGS